MFRRAFLLCFITPVVSVAQQPSLPAQQPVGAIQKQASPFAHPEMQSLSKTQDSTTSGATSQAAKPGELPPASAGPRQFLLQPGTCAPLAPGDSFTFSIKPIFVSSMADAVIGDVTVGFQTRDAQKPTAVTRFYANDNLLDQPRATTNHGYAKVVFQPELSTVPAGEYHLVNVTVRGTMADQSTIAEVNITHGGPQAVEALGRYCVIVSGAPAATSIGTSPTATSSTVLIEPLSLPK